LEKNRQLFFSINYNYQNRLRRQDAEKVLGKQFVEDGSFYIFKPALFLKNENRLAGKITAYLYESWKSPQIDSINDLENCKKLFQSKLYYKIIDNSKVFQNTSLNKEIIPTQGDLQPVEKS
jgi:CMP-N-acetylneuraminic acid synthetase